LIICVQHSSYYVSFIHIFICNVTTDVRCSGWLFKLEVKNLDELKELMDEKAYEAYILQSSDDEKQPI